MQTGAQGRGGVLINQNFIRCQTSSIQQETFLFNKKLKDLQTKIRKKRT